MGFANLALARCLRVLPKRGLDHANRIGEWIKLAGLKYALLLVIRRNGLCENGPDLWLNLQRRYDLHQAERELGEEINNIPTLEVA